MITLGQSIDRGRRWSSDPAVCTPRICVRSRPYRRRRPLLLCRRSSQTPHTRGSGANDRRLLVTPSARPYLGALASIRFIAAVHVVLYHHRSDAFMVAMPGFIRQIVNGGYVAVGLFFVLSGFILTYTYVGDRHRNLDPRAFWIARLARIYPVYLLAFVVGAPLYFRYSVATVEPLG